MVVPAILNTRSVIFLPNSPLNCLRKIWYFSLIDIHVKSKMYFMDESIMKIAGNSNFFEKKTKLCKKSLTKIGSTFHFGQLVFFLIYRKSSQILRIFEKFKSDLRIFGKFSNFELL